MGKWWWNGKALKISGKLSRSAHSWWPWGDERKNKELYEKSKTIHFQIIPKERLPRKGKNRPTLFMLQQLALGGLKLRHYSSFLLKCRHPQQHLFLWPFSLKRSEFTQEEEFLEYVVSQLKTHTFRNPATRKASWNGFSLFFSAINHSAGQAFLKRMAVLKGIFS